MSRKTRILLADDEPHVREFLKAIISSISGTELIGEATNGIEAVTLTQQLLPDIVLLDVNMPIMTGVEALEQIKAKCENTIVVMLTSVNGIDVVKDCIKKGAINYLLKGNTPDKIRDTLKTISFNYQTYYKNQNP